MWTEYSVRHNRQWVNDLTGQLASFIDHISHFIVFFFSLFYCFLIWFFICSLFHWTSQGILSQVSFCPPCLGCFIFVCILSPSSRCILPSPFSVLKKKRVVTKWCYSQLDVRTDHTVFHRIIIQCPRTMNFLFSPQPISISFFFFSFFFPNMANWLLLCSVRIILEIYVWWC